MDCLAGFPAIYEVILLHIIDNSPLSSHNASGSQEEHARDLLKADKTVLSGIGLQVRTCLEVPDSGSIHECIEAVAQREQVDLIVMSAGGGGLIKGLHLGSVSHGVIHHSSFNLLIIRYRVIEGMSGSRYEKFCPMILSRVLIPIDMSPQSLQAISIIAKTQGIGQINLLHIIPGGKESEEAQSRQYQAKIVIENLCSELKKSGINASGDVLIGEPVPTVLKYADEKDVSVIALVPYGKSWITEMIHGSFTCDLASQTIRPTLILKEATGR
jgi:nucleotide-binding universal stress UspA family protein